MVAVIVAVVGTPFALMAEALICNILAAETIGPVSRTKVANSQHTRANGIRSKASDVSKQHREMAWDSVHELRRVEEGLSSTAEDDFKALTRDIHAYRNSLLTHQEKKDFDSKCVGNSINMEMVTDIFGIYLAAIWGLDITTKQESGGVIECIRICGGGLLNLFPMTKSGIATERVLCIRLIGIEALVII